MDSEWEDQYHAGSSHQKKTSLQARIPDIYMHHFNCTKQPFIFTKKWTWRSSDIFFRVFQKRVENLEEKKTCPFIGFREVNGNNEIRWFKTCVSKRFLYLEKSLWQQFGNEYCRFRTNTLHCFRAFSPDQWSQSYLQSACIVPVPRLFPFFGAGPDMSADISFDLEFVLLN